MDLRNEPLLTRIVEDHQDFQPVSNSLYIALNGIEQRSGHFTALRQAATGVVFMDVVLEGDNEFAIQLANGGNRSTYRLRSRKQLAGLWDRSDCDCIYVDITGLRHHIWIPLLRSAIASGKHVRAVYVEPERYKSNATPTEGQIYDLSERIGGIEPIPGFAALARTGDDFLFLPLLGFEGPRVAYLMEQIQPLDDKIIPIVGVPGFRPEHHFSTYLGNRIALQESNAWQRVRFADANCPFSLFYLLEQIGIEYNNAYCKIAVVGTKPHALGATLYVLQDPARRELVYDHPIRKRDRTSGIGRLLEYDISGFTSL